MGNEIVMNGGGNIILAEGRSRGFWRPWRIILATSFGASFLLMFLGGWLLSRPLPLPKETLFYVVVTPAQAKALPEAVSEALPQDWKTYLTEKSRLPYIFGIYRQGESFFSFVISPSWHAPKTEKIHTNAYGLVRFASDTELTPERNRSYLSFLLEHWGSRAPVAGVRPFEALGYEQEKDESWIKLRLTSSGITSNVKATQAPADALGEADVSLHLPQETSPSLTERLASLPYFPAADRRARLPVITRADFTFDDPGKAEFTRLEFERALTEEEAGVLLGAYGFTMRQAIVLPDGTTSFEHMEPAASSGTTLFGMRTDELGRIVDISDKTFILKKSTSTSDLRYAKSCSESPAWMRLSANTVSILARQLGMHLDTSQTRPLQVISEKGKLAICFE